ncbi:hypothetical protein L7F22_039654 [Adiantum nelumboides]|nr:hypothetical protein [Adiantum nelumboides]
MERELSTSRSHRGAQHGLPSIPPLGASGSSRHPPPPPASGGGGGLIRMGEVTSANGDSRSRDSRGHRGSRSTRGDSYEPSRDRSRDYDYDYGYDSTSRGASRSRGDDYDAYYSSRSGYPEDSYGSSRRRRGSLGHDDYDPYYDRGHSRGGYDDYAYDRAYDYERSHHDDSYYDYGYGYDDYGRGGRDPREADHWLGSASDPDPTSKSTKSTGVFDPFKNSGLLNFKSFAALAKAANHPSVDLKDKLFAEYTTYRLEFQKRLLRTFFESNYDRVWFKEKYSNTVVDGIDYAADRKERVKKGRSGRKNHWLQELRAGEIDGVCWDLRTASKEVIEEDTAPVDPRDSGVPVGFKGPAAASFTRNGRERIQHENAIIPPDPTLLFILSLPPDQSRKGLEAVLEKQPGYQYLALENRIL